MIREFKLKRMFFVPVGFLNSVARWCLGIRSSDGSVEITNTADPGSNGSADLRVNIESVSNRIRERFDTMGFSEAERNSVKAIIRGTMDGVSIVNIGEHFGVSESWITQTIEKNIGDSFVEKGTPFVAGKYVKVGADGKLVTSYYDDDFLTENDIGIWVCSERDYEVLLDDYDELADDVDSILADYLTSADIGVSVAAQNHTHSEYAASNHTHSYYASSNHTHSDYAASNHTHSGYASSSHAHGNITSDGKLNGCTSNDCLVITGAGGVITHSNSSPKASDVASLVSQWITNGRTIGGGSIDHTKITDWASATSGFLDLSDYDALADAIGDLADIVDGCLFPADIGVSVAAQNHTHSEYAESNHTHSEYAESNHTHSEYAAVNHTHSGSDYAAVNHTHSGYAAVNHTHSGYAAVNHTHSGYASSSHTHSGYASSNHTHSGYASSSHAHSGYASSSHAHGNITSDGKLNGCTSNDCLVITGAGGVITHSNSSPKASDVASLVSQWITNGRTIGGGSIDHTKITDWASATSGFLDSSDYDALADAIGNLADIVDGCLFPADIGVTVAAKNHTHTTANISDWSTATASFLTDADLDGYELDADLAALEGTVYDLSDVVDGILADYVTSADLGDYITTDEIPANFLTAIASRKSGSFTFLTNIQFDGTNLQKKTQTVTITQGVVTNLGTESAWSTWHTPTVITWS